MPAGERRNAVAKPRARGQIWALQRAATASAPASAPAVRRTPSRPSTTPTPTALRRDALLACPHAVRLTQSADRNTPIRSRKQRCAIFDNARSIGLEFGCLYLIAAYGLTYALRDVRWAMMLTRSSAPLESTGSVGGAPPFAEPSSSSHDDTDGDGAGDVVKLIRPPPATPSSAR
eukprot:1198943-Prymnesium_polylepis.1